MKTNVSHSDKISSHENFIHFRFYVKMQPERSTSVKKEPEMLPKRLEIDRISLSNTISGLKTRPGKDLNR